MTRAERREWKGEGPVSNVAEGGSEDEADGGADPEAGAVDRADYDPNYDPDAPVLCEVCGGEMIYTAACKLKCLRCGYARDCSDP